MITVAYTCHVLLPHLVHDSEIGLDVFHFYLHDVRISGSLTTITRELARCKLDIVHVQEVRWAQGGTVRAEDYILFWECSVSFGTEYCVFQFPIQNTKIKVYRTIILSVVFRV
jgi:hypothetical protein